MRRLFGITAWLLIGSAAVASIYWGFLNTPESTIPALLLSAVLVLITLVIAGITVNGASLAWSVGWSNAVVRRSISGVPAFVAAALVAGAIWWGTAQALWWVTTYSGQISAWFIARYGWADPSPLFNTITWGGRWLQWVVGPLLALSLLGSLLIGEWSAARWRWLARGLSPFRLTLATLWVAIFVAAPWIYLLPWRPRGVPPTSMEVVFVTAKLGVVALLITIGASLVVRESIDGDRSREGHDKT
ncbi:MAG: hypothetical protein ACRD2N_26940 [Vicinamibacterales bacterium]